MLHRRHIAHEVHDLERFALAIENRDIVVLDPGIVAAGTLAFVFLGNALAAIKFGPEIAIFVGLRIVGRHENAVVAADDVGQLVAALGEQHFVGRDDRAVDDRTIWLVLNDAPNSAEAFVFRPEFFGRDNDRSRRQKRKSAG